MMATKVKEGWKNFGLLKGIGIPAPTGKHVVGCVDLMHKLEGDSDGLLVRLFYPAHPTVREGDEYPYARLTPNRMYTKGLLEFFTFKFPGALSFLLYYLTDARQPAFYGAPLYGSSRADSESALPKNATMKCPAVVYSHGLSGMRTSGTTVCCDLASHGYAVASVEHRDRSCSISLKRVQKPGAAEGELVDEWVGYLRPDSEKDSFFDPQCLEDVPLRHEQVKTRSFDVKQVLKLLDILNDGGTVHNMLDEDGFDFGMFKGCLDLDKAAVMGHSFGGSATVMALSEEPRLKCGIAMDSWMVPFPDDLVAELSIKQPLLFINSYDWQWKENVQKILRVKESFNQHGSEKSLVTINESNHFNQVDVFFLLSRSTTRYVDIPVSRIDPLIACKVNLELIHAFYQRHLLKDPGYEQNVPILDGGDGCSEHVIYGTNIEIT